MEYKNKHNPNVAIGIGNLPNLKKPCLYIRKGVEVKKLATFQSVDAVLQFQEAFETVVGVNRIKVEHKPTDLMETAMESECGEGYEN